MTRANRPTFISSQVPVPPTPPVNGYLAGNYAPVREEHPPTPLRITHGAIPDGLRGTLYRMGPCPAFEPTNVSWYHWFDGHGMMDAFRIDDGQVTNQNRWVRSWRFEHAQKAGRELYGGIRNVPLGTTLEGFLSLGLGPLSLASMAVNAVLGRCDTPHQIHALKRALSGGNTNLMPLCGKLLAMEELAYPYLIDPDTLDTVGQFTFDGALDGHSMIPHPCVDPDTGEVFTMAYDNVPPFVRYTVLNKDGSLKMRRNIDVPWPSMMHAFVVSKKHAIFFQWPNTFWGKDLASHRPVRWNPSLGGFIGVVDRYSADAKVRWYECPANFAFHYGNAHDDGREIVIDLSLYGRMPLLDLGSDMPSLPVIENGSARQVRWRLHLDTGVLVEQEIDDSPNEFPLVDPRVYTHQPKFGYCIVRRGTGDAQGLWNSVMVTDWARGENRFHDFGAKSWTSEAVFAPRPGSDKELDGWLLMTVYRSETNTTDLVVLDPQRIEDEPVCVASMDRRVQFGFHGSWVAR